MFGNSQISFVDKSLTNKFLHLWGNLFTNSSVSSGYFFCQHKRSATFKFSSLPMRRSFHLITQNMEIPVFGVEVSIFDTFVPERARSLRTLQSKFQQDLAAQIVCSSYVACNLSRLDSMMNEWSKLPITSILLPSCEPVNFLLHNPQGSNLAKANVIWKLIDVVMPTLRGHTSKEVKILQKRGRRMMMVVTQFNGHGRNCQL